MAGANIAAAAAATSANGTRQGVISNYFHRKKDAVSPPPLRRTSKRTADAAAAASSANNPAKNEENDDNETATATPRKKRARIDNDAEAEPEQDETKTSPAKTPRSKAKQSPKKATPSKTAENAGTPKKATPKKSSADKVKAEEPPKSANGEVVESKTHNLSSHKAAAVAPAKTANKKSSDVPATVPRTEDCPLAIGAHVSMAGGVHNAIQNALNIGANSLACFLKSQRKWANPDLKEEHALAFKDACKEHDYDASKSVVPHGSYLVNLAAPEKDKAEQAYASFVDDLKRCDRLGIGLYNFHPGNTNGTRRSEAIARLAAQLNRAHKETKTVITLLENMAASPEANTIGGRFEDLRDVIALIDDKSRVGVCLDTCHAFAAGYDLRSPEAYAATMAQFDKVIGAGYLKAVHVNDSKGVLGSHRDLHQNIGAGFLGLRAFWNLCNDDRVLGMPLVLETPIDRPDPKHPDNPKKTVEDRGVWGREIKLLESLRGMALDGDEFRELEARLASEGAGERAKLQAQFDKKGKK